jgi:hypothetical protein
MTTKKKTLIELMLDAGVKPEDVKGDFIVCDKVSHGGPCVRSYNFEPVFIKKQCEWTYTDALPSLIELPYFIANWKSVIITKQQFVDAYNEKHKFKEPHEIPAWDKQLTKEIYSFSDDNRVMNKGVTNIAEDKQVEDIEPCKVVDNSAYDCASTDDSGISLSFEEAEKRADNYASLSNVLRRAYDQASSGKGQERHGQDLPFAKQPMQLIQDLCGEGFALGQAMKKMQESQRLPHDAAIRELLGAINYIAGAIIHKEKLQGSK